jgi:hypothetical protein
MLQDVLRANSEACLAPAAAQSPVDLEGLGAKAHSAATILESKIFPSVLRLDGES